MEQTWTYQRTLRSAPISPGVALFVDLIGIDKTADLLLACGGSYVSAGQLRSKNGLVDKAVGEEAARTIGREFVGGNFKCPVGSPFLIRYLFSKGKNINEIARTVHMDAGSVSRNLKGFHPAEDIDASPFRRKKKP